jgi:hypothetical protein
MKHLRNAAIVLAALVTAVLLGCASSSSPPANLTNSLTSGLGVTTDQANGGVGSILSYAQNKLPASDYTKVANSIPGASDYVQKAKDLGAVTGPITDTVGLNSAFSKMGISPEIASKFTPMVLDYVGKVGGSTAKSLLGGIL